MMHQAINNEVKGQHRMYDQIFSTFELSAEVPVQNIGQNDGTFSCPGEPFEDQVAHYSNWKEQLKAPAFLSTPLQVSV